MTQMSSSPLPEKREERLKQAVLQLLEEEREKKRILEEDGVIIEDQKPYLSFSDEELIPMIHSLKKTSEDNDTLVLWDSVLRQVMM